MKRINRNRALILLAALLASATLTSCQKKAEPAAEPEQKLRKCGIIYVCKATNSDAGICLCVMN